MVFTREDGDFHGRAVSFREGSYSKKKHMGKTTVFPSTNPKNGGLSLAAY